MKRYILLASVFILISCKLTAQNIYKNSIEGCDTSRFALESKTPTATINNKEFVKIIADAIPKNKRNSIKGVLKLQIIVYTNGGCCLLSYENNTNVSDDEINIKNLKNSIDTKLEWNNKEENVAVLAEFYFKNKKIVFKRFGIHGDLGWHELKE